MIRRRVTGLVLSGGASRRMQALGGAVDKGLLPLDGRLLVRHALERLTPQVGALLIVANDHLDQYRRFGPPVVTDDPALPGRQGPLAGIVAALQAIAAGQVPSAGDGEVPLDDRWLATVPCDCPDFPLDLVERLAAVGDRADIAFATTARGRQPVFSLIRLRARQALAAAFAAGERRLGAAFASTGALAVRFDDEAAFVNLNTPADLAAAVQAAGHGRELSVDEARAAILARVRPVAGTVTVALGDALGRVLADDLPSPIDVPPHDNSAMDGYAVRSADLPPDRPVSLVLSGRALAGRPFAGACGAGQTVRIMTGAPLPAGADTVVAQELVGVADDGRIVIPGGQPRGQHCRRRGEDLAAGSIALAGGRRLRPADLGLAAALGIGALTVRRRPRVAVLSTGDELVDAAEPRGHRDGGLDAGRIFDSNRVVLLAAVARLGLEPVDAGIVADRPDALAEVLGRTVAGVDAVLSSGGVSVGDADHTRGVIARLGTVHFERVAMRPGRPLAFGTIGDCLYVGLPGNPVAVLIAFHFIVRDALLRLAGADASPLPRLRIRCGDRLRKRPGRTEFQRGRFVVGADGELEVVSTGAQGSGILRSMSEADAIIVLDAGRGDVAAGEPVDVVPLQGLD